MTLSRFFSKQYTNHCKVTFFRLLYTCPEISSWHSDLVKNDNKFGTDNKMFIKGDLRIKYINIDTICYLV